MVILTVHGAVGLWATKCNDVKNESLNVIAAVAGADVGFGLLMIGNGIMISCKLVNLRMRR